MTKTTNPHRITVKQWLDEEGYETIYDALDVLRDSVVPALCDEGCQVEPDGRCEHGCPAVTLAIGVI